MRRQKTLIYWDDTSVIILITEVSSLICNTFPIAGRKSMTLQEDASVTKLITEASCCDCCIFPERNQKDTALQADEGVINLVTPSSYCNCCISTKRIMERPECRDDAGVVKTSTPCSICSTYLHCTFGRARPVSNANRGGLGSILSGYYEWRAKENGARQGLPQNPAWRSADPEGSTCYGRENNTVSRAPRTEYAPSGAGRQLPRQAAQPDSLAYHPGHRLICRHGNAIISRCLRRPQHNAVRSWQQPAYQQGPLHGHHAQRRIHCAALALVKHQQVICVYLWLHLGAGNLKARHLRNISQAGQPIAPEQQGRFLRIKKVPAVQNGLHLPQVNVSIWNSTIVRRVILSHGRHAVGGAGRRRDSRKPAAKVQPVEGYMPLGSNFQRPAWRNIFGINRPFYSLWSNIKRPSQI